MSRVARVADEEVWCVGLAFDSPTLRAVRDAWLASLPSDAAARRAHSPHPGDGHAALAYVRGAHRRAAERALAPLRARCRGATAPLEAVVFQDTTRRICEVIALGPAAAAAATTRSAGHCAEDEPS